MDKVRAGSNGRTRRVNFFNIRRLRAPSFVLWCLLIVLLVGCGGGAGGGAGGGGARAKAGAGVTEMTIEGFEYGFDPEEFEMNRGDTVRIIFRNTGILAHDWAIPEWNLRTPEIAPGEEATIEFTAEKTGSIRFICTVPGHEQLGMVGTLHVR